VPDVALTTYASVALFVDRARRVRPDFTLSPDNAPDIAGICIKLDGLPLALELAAARIKLLPPRALLSRLSEASGSNVLGVLSGGARDLPQRQQTLRDTIAWSYDLLAPEEQALFRRLGVFAGGCTLDAARAVCRVPVEDDEHMSGQLDVTFTLVASLLDKSLVYQEIGMDGEPRYYLLETIRAFALERLAASEEEALLRRRHATFYLGVVEQSGGLLFAEEQRRLRISAEQGNIHLALRWLVLEG
jgi:predicted ATPase